MLKKILTLCLVLCMLASIPAFAALDDIAGEKFEKEISLLNSIGIVEGKEPNAYKPADKLTRAEMTTIVLRLMDVEPSIPAAFEDVAADHWASKIIGSAAQLGIINGMSATTFAPEENVTYPQAAKMLVCTLGYGVEAEALGGYPTGYLAKASQLGVLKATADDGQPISRAVMAKMVANSLEVDLLVRKGYGSEYTYEPEEGANLLNKYLGLAVIEGVVDANYTLNLGGASCEEDEAAIGDDVIKVGETALASFIGREVKVYAKEDDMADTFTAIHVEAKKNSEFFTIDAEDVLDETTAKELVYDVDGTEYTFEIEGAKLYVNGDAKELTADAIKEAEGAISVTSADGIKADYIFVSQYIDGVVDKVTASSAYVTFKNTDVKPLTLDVKDKSKKISITDAEGKTVNVKDLKEWDVLTIKKNAKGSVIDVIVASGTSFTGKIEEYDSADETVVINDKSFEVAAKLAGTKEKTADLIGVEAVFYTNYLGKVVAADTENVAKDYKYGYIVRYAKGQGVDGNESVKIFTEDGVMKVFTLDEDYKIKNVETAEKVLSFAGGALSAEMLLKFRTNKDGEIYELETLAAPVTNLGNFIGGSRYFQNGGYILSDNTVIFKVPADNYTGEDKYYSIMKGSEATHWTTPFNYAYEIDDMKIGVGLSKKKQSGIGDTLGVVNKVTSVRTEDGQFMTRIRLIDGKTIDFDPTFSQIEYRMIAFTSEKDVPNRLDRQYGGTDSKAWQDESNTVKFEDADGNALSADALDQGDVILYASPAQDGITSMIKIIFRANHAPYMPEYEDVKDTVSKETYDKSSFFANKSMGFDEDGKGYASLASYNLFAMYYVDHIDLLTNEVLSFTTAGYMRRDKALDINDLWNTSVLDYAAPENQVLSLEKVRACYLFDMEKGTIVESSVAEITEEDKIFYRLSNGTPVLVVIYRNMPAQ